MIKCKMLANSNYVMISSVFKTIKMLPSHSILVGIPNQQKPQLGDAVV